MQDSIPSLDLSQFAEGSDSDKKQFVADIGAAYENYGFVAIKNHLLQPETEKNLYQYTKKFFQLPEDVKRSYEMEDGSGQRGYTSFGVEHAKDHPVADLKEFWHFGQTIEDGNYEAYGYPENKFVSEVPEFNKYGLEAYSQLENTGKVVLQAIALYLGLDEYYFDEFVENGNSILRPIHYGPITEEPKNAVRAGQHEDINLITLLMGASAAGLEILTKQGEWLPVTALPNQLVVNVGDMLQRLTNNRLRSTTHRVVNPPRSEWHQSRYSIPFFLHPVSDMPLNCLESCVDEEHPIQYEPITAGAYLQQRLIEIGLAK
jgi:isopenicillin N synthase-like dioxygenase